MNKPTQSQGSSYGYLIVKVSTARGAIPLENASVFIRGAQSGNNDVIYSLKTNSAGLTQKVSLPAPARTLSESPGNTNVFAVYNVDVFKDGYTDLHLLNVAIFSSVTSVQPAIMIPLSDNEYPDNFSPDPNASPSDIERTPSGGGSL